MNMLQNPDGTGSFEKIRECIDIVLRAARVGVDMGPAPIYLDAFGKGGKSNPGNNSKGLGGFQGQYSSGYNT